MNLTPADILAMTAHNPAAREAVRRQLAPKATAQPAETLVEAVRQVARGMNKWEASFSRHLEYLKSEGVILQWGFEGIKLRIGTHSDAKGSRAPHYTPDFFAVLPDGRLRFYEVKGFFREAAKVRSGVAAGLFPHFSFVVVRLVKGRWQTVESFNGGEK